MALGFVESEKELRDPRSYADIGCPVEGLWYGYRVHQGQYQYVSLCAYLGEFVEAVVMVYQTKFNSRQKPQQTPLNANSARSEEDLLSLLNKVYEIPKKS